MPASRHPYVRAGFAGGRRRVIAWSGRRVSADRAIFSLHERKFNASTIAEVGDAPTRPCPNHLAERAREQYLPRLHLPTLLDHGVDQPQCRLPLIAHRIACGAVIE